MAEHRERDRDDGVVTRHLRAPGGGLIVDDDGVGRLIDGDHLRAETNAAAEIRQEGARQVVHAAVDFDHVRVVVAGVFAQQLQERRVHQRFLIRQQAEHLDRPFRPFVGLEKLARRVLIVFRDDLRPRGAALCLEQRGDGLQRLHPELRRGLAAFVGGDLEPQRVGIRVGLADPNALAVQIVEGVGVPHGERGDLDVELVDVRHRQVMRPGNAHRARLGIQPVAERFAQRADPAPDALLGLEDNRFVPGALQFVGGRQPGHAGADDDDLFPGRRARRKPGANEREIVEGR